MSDDEFEGADAGAEGCKPVSVGSIKKGGYVMIKGFPCKVVDYSTCKTGKHGSAKATIVGVDIFTARKYEMFAPTSATAQEPIVTRIEYQVVDLDESDVSDEGAIASIMNTESGETIDDLRIPMLDDEYKSMREAIKENASGAGKDVYVTVLSALGKSKILPMHTTK